MAQTVGELIKEARTGAGLSQEKLAGMIDGVSAGDISKAERGEKELSQAVLKQIAKATGVTQSSLINAAKGTTATAKKSTSTTKSSGTSTKKTTTTKSSSSSSKTKVELTAAEKKLVELYRAADTETRKNAVSILKGETTGTDELIGSLIEKGFSMLGNLKK